MLKNQIFFLIVAAGKGKRFGSAIKKQYLEINGLPILSHTLSKFLKFAPSAFIVLVVPPDDLKYCKINVLEPVGITENNFKNFFLIPGGNQRQESVQNGLNLIRTMSKNYAKDIVLIHDGVRPFINSDFIERCINGASETGACVPGVQAVDTIKEVKNGMIVKTLNRSDIFQIQTPQAFSLKIIIEAMDYAKNNNYSGTDDASIVEFFGKNVAVIAGLKQNIKITTKEDFNFAKAYFSSY
jgi:2-C-methyl-D-erythritol 4-phosphate cytidylyltransferase